MFRATSRLRHKSKRKLVHMCIEKESEGWNCIVPIHHAGEFHKHYCATNSGHVFDSLDHSVFWEAVYQKG